MIFIGAELSDPKAHFVTNIVKSIGTGDDLVIDLLHVKEWAKISTLIVFHCNHTSEEFVIYNAWEDESLPLHFKQDFPDLKLIAFFSDDEWRHANYDRYLALFANLFTVAVKGNLDRYRNYGLGHVYYMRWGCNQASFFPMTGLDQVYDVTFIGAAYGKRVEYVRFLLSEGVKISVFGPGWGLVRDVREHWGGILTHQEMIRVINQTKINLNFLWTSRKDGSTTIKGRTMELAACKAFQLSNRTEEFFNYGFVSGENIAVFSDKNDLIEKIRYYLAQNSVRRSIAQSAYELVLANLTWEKQFAKAFEHLRKNPVQKPLSRFRVLVVLKDHIEHQISIHDDRLDIKIVAEKSDWRANAENVDGVVMLSSDTTLTNDTLYMMVFGLLADKSDLIAANFYVGSEKSPTWIRFRDQLIEKTRDLLRILPSECLMFSGDHARKYGCSLRDNLEECKVSYIEYPSFRIKLPYYWTRKLRLYFAHHSDSRSQLRKYASEFKWAKAFSIGIDKLWQRAFRYLS